MDQESTAQPTATPTQGRARFRRRPPTSIAERQRRKAWGAKWGKLLSDAAKQVKRETEAT